MHDGMELWAWIGALLIAALVPAAVVAQPMKLGVREGAPECLPLEECTDDQRCDDGQCMELADLQQSFCVPEKATWCCAYPQDCRRSSSSADPEPITCVEVEGLGGGVCVPEMDRRYCGEEPISEARLVACHTNDGTRTLVPYEEGDCDGDGILNGRDADPCLPPRIGVWVDDGDGARRCVAEEVERFRCSPSDADRCHLPDGTDGQCIQNARTGQQPLCSVEPHVFCCGIGVGGARVHCPNGDPCTMAAESDDGFDGYCVHPARLCNDEPTAKELHDCHTYAGALTSFEDGDCDNDGIRNRDEEPGRLCIYDRPDAGVPMRDAGARPDGGSSARDAGAAMDAGRSDEGPSFAGGGGYTCRSAPGQPSSLGLGWLTFVAIALVTVLRRR